VSLESWDSIGSQPSVAAALYLVVPFLVVSVVLLGIGRVVLKHVLSNDSARAGSLCGALSYCERESEHYDHARTKLDRCGVQ
jgi:hypothetical protein